MQCLQEKGQSLLANSAVLKTSDVASHIVKAGKQFTDTMPKNYRY